MRIIIIGSGKSCEVLVQQMEKSAHDIIVVDKDKKIVDTLTDRYSVNGVCGSGASREVLLAAGADTADLLISLTPVDEINLLACSMAKQMGTRYTAARLTRDDLTRDLTYLRESFHLDCVVNPKEIFAQALASQVFFNAANRVEPILGTLAMLAEVAVEKDSILDHAKLHELKPLLQSDFLILGVFRGDKLQVPKGDFVLEAGDIIGILALPAGMRQILAKTSLTRKPVKNAMLVGGGEIGRILAGLLQEHKIKVTLVESDRKRCAELCEAMPSLNVVYGDAAEVDLLEEAGIRKQDVCVCTTGSDETNLLVSLIAWSNGVNNIIARIGSDAYDRVLRKVTINITMSPDRLLAGQLMDYIHSLLSGKDGRDASRYYQLGPGMIHVHDFTVPQGFERCGKPLMAGGMRLKKGIILGAILRRRETVIPKGTDVLQTGDRVLVITDGQQTLSSLSQIFA